MQHAFLREFPRRMKVVGLYAVLLSNSSQKQKWKQYGFEREEEQINLLFAILLFIMEESLKEEHCTIDDVAVFLDDINAHYFRKAMSLEDCRDLSDFLVNTVLSNDGLQMQFHGYDFEKNAFENIHISYVANKIVYDQFDNRRTSYYLTENGYSLLLGTLEVENNMRLTLQEIIFNEHLKKRHFDKALEDIKSIFELMRIEKLKNDEAIARMRQNILNFSIEDYSRRVDETFSTVTNTRTKLEKYKEIVNDSVRMIEREGIDVDHVTEKDTLKLETLREINRYLDRTIDCHMEIMNSYNSYRDICAREMENFLTISRVERFSFSRDLFNPILEDAAHLDCMALFLHPLFLRKPDKIFNLNKVFLPQRLREEYGSAQALETIDFDEESWRREQEAKQATKNALYEGCLLAILSYMQEKRSVLLSEIARHTEKHPEERSRLIPTVSIFKEIMVDLIRTAHFDVAKLKEERKATLTMRDEHQFDPLHSSSLVIGDLFLAILDTYPEWSNILHFFIRRTEGKEAVLFSSLQDVEAGRERTVTLSCTDIAFSLVR